MRVQQQRSGQQVDTKIDLISFVLFFIH